MATTFPWTTPATAPARRTSGAGNSFYNWISNERNLPGATQPAAAFTPVTSQRSTVTPVAGPSQQTSSSIPGVGGVTGARQFKYTAAPTAVTTIKNDPLGGLNPVDLADIMQQRRAITRALQGAERGYNTGVQAAADSRNLDFRRAFQGARGGANVALSGGTGGFGDSPATSGVGLAAVAAGLAAEKAAAEQSYAQSTAALQRALQEAQASYSAGNTDLAADIARRRDYANTVRKYT